MYDHISDIEHKGPTPEQVKEIQEGFCIHCYKPYGVAVETVFVELSDKRIIWWHKRQSDCKTHASRS
jgi:hypothetical protein